MKISNSKKELARIISENGGWRDGANWAVQHGTDRVAFTKFERKPSWEKENGCWGGCLFFGGFTHKKISNYHQTILSREEYFHLYPAPDADWWIEWNGEPKSPVDKGTLVDVKMKDGACHEAQILDDENWGHYWGDGDIIAYRPHKPEQSIGELCDKVTEENKHEHVDCKPTIEQLTADYRNRKEYADRKQQEADAAKADADEALRKLELAGEAIGLIVTPVSIEKEPELVITDWRDLLVGDIVWVDAYDNHPEGEWPVNQMECASYDCDYAFSVKNGVSCERWISVRKPWRFIRRP